MAGFGQAESGRRWRVGRFLFARLPVQQQDRLATTLIASPDLSGKSRHQRLPKNSRKFFSLAPNTAPRLAAPDQILNMPVEPQSSQTGDDFRHRPPKPILTPLKAVTFLQDTDNQARQVRFMFMVSSQPEDNNACPFVTLRIGTEVLPATSQ
jgi:hypothetical protein